MEKARGKDGRFEQQAMGRPEGGMEKYVGSDGEAERIAKNWGREGNDP